MLRKALSVLWAFTVLGLSGCMFFPSESLYSGGFAWVGDDLYLYAPMCEGEELTGIDLHGVKNDPEDLRSIERVDLWAVRGPLATTVSDGWVVLGDDSAFADVVLNGTDPNGWPEIVGILVTHQDAGEEFRSELTLDKGKDLPRYSAGSDPLTIEYYFDGPGTERGGERLTPAQIRDQMGCAKQYF